jgi:hypothetical protein
MTPCIAGLRLPSIVRLEKLATVEKSTVIRRMGQIEPGDWEKVKVVLKQFFVTFSLGDTKKAELRLNRFVVIPIAPSVTPSFGSQDGVSCVV